MGRASVAVLVLAAVVGVVAFGGGPVIDTRGVRQRKSNPPSGRLVLRPCSRVLRSWEHAANRIPNVPAAFVLGTTVQCGNLWCLNERTTVVSAFVRQMCARSI